MKRIVEELRHLDPVGFYTAEIREGGGVIAETKKRRDVKLRVVGPHDRDSLLPEILALVLP